MSARHSCRWVSLSLHSSYFTASSHVLIGVDDFAPGSKPYALMLLHVRDGALEILDPQRLARDHGMQRNAHDARLLAAVGIERIELVDHGPEVLFARVALADVERDVVDLVAIRDGEHLSRLHFHRIGLIVVVPVAAIVHALFGENVERVVGLDQPRAQPSARPFPGRLLDGPKSLTHNNAREIGGSDALACGGKGFQPAQSPRLIESSQASTAGRLAGALRFKPLKRLVFIFGQALRRLHEAAHARRAGACTCRGGPRGCAATAPPAGPNKARRR